MQLTQRTLDRARQLLATLFITALSLLAIRRSLGSDVYPPEVQSCTLPLAGLALRSRWAAYVLGGFLAVAAVMLVPQLFVAFSDLTSISQSRRAAGFWPLAFSFAGGFVVLGALLLVALLWVAVDWALA